MNRKQNKRVLLTFILLCMGAGSSSDTPKKTPTLRRKNILTSAKKGPDARSPYTKASHSLLGKIETQMDIASEPEEPTPAPISTALAVVDPLRELSTASESESIQKSLRDLEERIAPETDQEPVLVPEKPLEPASVLTNEETIEFYFENVSLDQVLLQISEMFKVSFITDDVIEPLPAGGKSIRGNKLSFKTNKPLPKKKAWDLFLSFMNLADFAVIPTADPKIYRVTTVQSAKTSALPTFIGVDSTTLPDNDQMIRYIYFVENSTTEMLNPIVVALKSPAAQVIDLRESNAFIITDKSYNIKSLMQIIRELDKVSMPQSMSVIKLRRSDAQQVKDLYTSLTQTGQQPNPRTLQRRPSTSIYFPENVRIIAEPRTNSLIVLGPVDAIKKIEDFITQYVDVELGAPYAGIHIHQLKYADATTVANIMTNVTSFGQRTEAGKYGGVRAGDKFIKPMTFTPEPATNSLIIKGDYEDYLRTKVVIEKLDMPQPQVGIEVMILSVDLSGNKILGSQMRNKQPNGPNGLFGDNIKFQTSGLRTGNANAPQGIVEADTGLPGVRRLLGNLIALVTPAGGPGTAQSTIITLGDSLGVWDIFQILDTVANTEVIANPFVVATNKTKAKVSVGEARRVVTGQVVSTTTENAFGTMQANLVIDITPQINNDGMIVLTMDIRLDNFIGAQDPVNVRLNTRDVRTESIVSNNEVIAVGGLIQNRVDNRLSKVPILGDIPILGWFFKNKQQVETKSNLLILITAKILEREGSEIITSFTQRHIDAYRTTLGKMQSNDSARDPVNRFMFQPNSDDVAHVVDNFVFNRAGILEKKVEQPVVYETETGPPINLQQPETETILQPITTSVKNTHTPSLDAIAPAAPKVVVAEAAKKPDKKRVRGARRLKKRGQNSGKEVT